MKKRIPIKVTLYDKNNDTVSNYQRTVKSRIIDDVQVGLKNKAVIMGVCRVTYSNENDYWNEFNFTTLTEFKNSLSIDTELSLIKEFYGTTKSD